MNTKAAIHLTAFVFICAFSLIRSTYFPEGDIFWGARNGLDTLRNGIHITQPDSWNLLTLGEEWSSNSWLWNLLLGVAYLWCGNYGFVLLTLVTNIAAFIFLWRYLQKLRMPPLGAFLTLVVSLVVMTIFMNGRSNTADFLILTVFLYLSRKCLDKPKTLLFVSFILTVLWMNLHMTGVAAVVVFPAVLFAMLHSASLRTRLVRAVITLLAVIIALPITPYGFEGLIKVSLVQNQSKGMMVEWSSVSKLQEGQESIILLLLVALVILILVFRKKQFLYGLVILTVGYGTYDTIRLAPFLLTLLLGALVLWEAEGFTLPSLGDRLIVIPDLVFGALVVLTLALSVVSVMKTVPLISNDEKMLYVSREELSLIPSGARAAVSQDMGSAIILYRPDVLVTLDGRNDLIGKERFIEASNILYADDSAKVGAWLKLHKIDTVFVQRSSTEGAGIIKKNMTELGWVKNKNSTDSVTYIQK